MVRSSLTDDEEWFAPIGQVRAVAPLFASLRDFYPQLPVVEDKGKWMENMRMFYTAHHVPRSAPITD